MVLFVHVVVRPHVQDLGVSERERAADLEPLPSSTPKLVDDGPTSHDAQVVDDILPLEVGLGDVSEVELERWASEPLLVLWIGLE